MKIFTNKFVVFFAIVVVAFFLRIHNYALFPVGGETADESAWTFLGASIIQERQPTSWSYFAPYQQGYIYAERANEAPLVRPALDHPPLFSLLPGFAHTLKGNWTTFPSIKVIRLPMVVLGTINVLLLLFLADSYFKKKRWVYLAGILYATIPSFVFASRLVVAENLLVTWTLLALLFLKLNHYKYRYIFLFLIGMLAILTKVSGIVIPLSILLYGALIKHKKTMMAGLWGLVVGIFLFALWGYLFNWQLFIEVFSSQAGRDLGLATLHNRLFLHPTIVEKLFFDGWILFGLLSLFVSVYKQKKTFLALHVFALLNLFFVAATSGEQTFHAWYDYMLYPLLVITIVEVLKRIAKKAHYLLFAFVWLIMTPLIRVAAVHGNWYQALSAFQLRVGMGLGLIPLGLSLIEDKMKMNRKVASLSMWVLIAVLIGLNIYSIIVFNQRAYWESDSFFYYR